MESIHDSRYASLIKELVRLRKLLAITQDELAARLKQPQSFVSKVECRERRLDVIELLDWCTALECSFDTLLQTSGIITGSSVQEKPPTPHIKSHSVMVPKVGGASTSGNNINLLLTSGTQEHSILLQNTTVEEYLSVEKYLSDRFQSLNHGLEKNRSVIADGLQFAISKMARCNPSDVYHHIVYRLFLREYNRTDPNQSWVRAGGEAVELFIEKQYKEALGAKGITIKALLGKDAKQAAIDEMGIGSEVSGSKLDIALWGKLKSGEEIIFGGIHVKASLAERVSDDIPCSRAMMRNGLASILFTFDAKSFPLPYGDLVNSGEFGSVSSPSDKRIYIEEHGAFDVALTYNTRIEQSPKNTSSGKRILVSTMISEKDILPKYVEKCWRAYAKKNSLK